MSETPAAIEGETEVEPEKAPLFSKKKMMTIIGIVLLVLVGGGGATAFLLLGSSADQADAAAEGHGGGEADETFIEVPAMIVNLRSVDGAARLLKLRVMLVPTEAGKGEAITARLPLVIDSFQPFLRELRPEDLAGSAAIFRIKEELLVRANAVVGAGTVKDVLIQDIIQQ